MSWHKGRLALYDCESTGVDPHRDRVVTAAIVEVGGGQPTRTSEWLINPGIDIPDAAAAVHGITTQHAVSAGVDAAGAIHEIGEHLLRCLAAGMPVVAYNGVYDLTMLFSELLRHDHQVVAEQVRDQVILIDPFVLDKHLDKWRKGSRKLIDTCAHYGIDLSESDAHGAAADALAAGRLAYKLAAQNSAIAGDANALHRKQIKWKREQGESFGAYLVKQGKPDDVSRAFPIEPSPDGWTPQQLPAQQQVPA